VGIFDKMKEPVFLKEGSNAVEQLEKLKALESRLNDEGKTKLMQEIKFVEYGIAGENNIAFELKNSHMPMYILHDIYLEDGDLSAQIDYLVFTKKLCFVIECKNLMGNIEINSAGDFIRTMEFGGRKKKEGIYSPLTQNQRHLELMKKIKIDSKTNIVIKLMAGKFFENSYIPIVVLANPKTILNAKFAKKEVKNQVIKADQLVAYIKDRCKYSREKEHSDNELLAWAQSFIELHNEVDKDYTSKFDQYIINNMDCEIKKIIDTTNTISTIVTEVPATLIDVPVTAKVVSTTVTKVPVTATNVQTKAVTSIDIEEMPIFKELRVYRLNKSREEKVKPYFIYNDSQLKDIISKMPTSPKKLIEISGFGEVKVTKYGADIIQIIKKHVVI
jgi:hypothetical protein